MGCQTEIAEKIVERKADHCLAVKRNLPTLHEGIIGFLQDLIGNEFTETRYDRHESFERAMARRKSVSI
jgi:hypothetical protein